MLSPQLIISAQRFHGTAQPIPGTLAEAAAEPARTLSCWQGAGELAAIPQGPGTALRQAKRCGRRGEERGLPPSLGNRKGERTLFLVWSFPRDVSQVHIYYLLPVKLCFYASQSHHFDVVCLA